MPKHCCVTKCRGNYDGGEQVFRLPRNKEKRARWMQAIPRDNTPDKPDTVVCRKHWPEDAVMVMDYGRLKPRDPPSIFSNIKPYFCNKDNIKTFEYLKSTFVMKQFNFQNRFSIFSYYTSGHVTIQSTDFETSSCIPRFFLKIAEDFTYQSFHCGIACTITSLSKNRILHLNTLSLIEEAISFLNIMEKDNKQKVLFQHVSTMAPFYVGEKKYESEIIIRSFEYFAMSRALYNRLRDDYQLSSVTTLTRLTLIHDGIR